jgi:hypothetical protein
MKQFSYLEACLKTHSTLKLNEAVFLFGCMSKDALYSKQLKEAVFLFGCMSKDALYVKQLNEVVFLFGCMSKDAFYVLN